MDRQGFPVPRRLAASRFVPNEKLIYAGDTGFKWGYFD